MANAFSGGLRGSLLATAAVVLLGSVGATCGVAVRSVSSDEGAREPCKGAAAAAAASDARSSAAPAPATERAR